MRYFLLTVLFVVLATSSSAQETQFIGSDSAGNYARTLDCDGDKVLVGFEIAHGQVGVGKIRGACRRVSSSGAWAGGASMTPWTQVDSNAESGTIRSTYCSQNQAVAGFGGRVQGVYIHALRIGCKALTGSGGTTGSISWKSYVGVSNGSQSSAIQCVSGRAARAARTRTRSNLHRFSLVCHEADVVAPATRTHTISGRDVGTLYQLAERARQRSSCTVVDPPSPPDATCALRPISAGLQVRINYNSAIVGPAPVAQANLTLFDNAQLPAGWTVREVDLHAAGPECSAQRTQPLLSNSLESHYRIDCTQPDRFVVRKVVLEGPDGTTWRSMYP